jgi:glycosyltransferase involved in cell wall biosynthesis
MSLRMSVVIPAYNEADYLADALTSLQRQDFRAEYEVIVVDNNSSDETATVAQSFGARVLHEAQPGVCAARQRGTVEARGEIVVSTDADTVHPVDWLSRLDAAFRAHPEAVAVAGPCRYADPPWWAATFPPLWFAAVAAGHRAFGRIFYLTATNVAFRRAGFPGYDTTLTQGGDEVDLLRRLQRWGPVVWEAGNPVQTSSRRMDQGLPYTLFVSFGYHYASAYLLSRISATSEVRVAPAIRRADEPRVRERRRWWRAGSAVAAVSLVGLVWARSHSTFGSQR